MPTDTRDGALKMVVEAPKKFEMAVLELKCMDSEASTTTAAKSYAEGGEGDIVIKYEVAEVAKENSNFGEKYKTTTKVPTPVAPVIEEQSTTATRMTKIPPMAP